MSGRIFAIADLHLSGAFPKPMDIFGAAWENHAARIAAHWREMIQPDDIVLIAGDISWALKLRDAVQDLEWIAALPGRKIISKGNHDYWWKSIGKVRQAAPPGLFFIQHDAVLLDGVAIGGTRLWDFPGIRWPVAFVENPHARKEISPIDVEARNAESEKIRARELHRLELSLAALDSAAEVRIAMVHYPPLGDDAAPSVLTEILAKFDLDYCVFGHVHSLGDAPRAGADCQIGKTRYLLTACDWVACKPRFIADIP